jgi:hypothetical protein
MRGGKAGRGCFVFPGREDGGIREGDGFGFEEILHFFEGFQTEGGFGRFHFRSLSRKEFSTICDYSISEGPNYQKKEALDPRITRRGKAATKKFLLDTDKHRSCIRKRVNGTRMKTDKCGSFLKKKTEIEG